MTHHTTCNSNQWNNEEASRLKENKIARSSEPQLDLISGNPDLPDEDAIIFFITGDGFNKNEQNKFWDEATKKAHELLSESPFDKFQNDIKIYGYNVISKDSGARGDSAKNHQEALNDKKDTYFGSTFWQNGIERLLIVPPENYKKVMDLSESQLPKVDQEIVIINSEKYGGSGGKFSVSSLNDAWAKELILHEMRHSFASLADNYAYGETYLRKAPNLTQETDHNKVKWKNRMEQNGIGIYELKDGWYKPSTNCKMEFVGSPFSDVAKDGIRDACKNILSQKNDDETGTSSSSSVEDETGNNNSSNAEDETGNNNNSSAEDETARRTLPSTGNKQSTYLVFIGINLLAILTFFKTNHFIKQK